ncbi:MAG: hypothetical protein LRY40_05075 [Shewanella fodinae]|nr:hypothetical protein [Shewanella fodinae]
MLQSAIELLPEISSPLERAFSQAQIGSIELMLGNLAEAEADINRRISNICKQQKFAMGVKS